jgi:hypothetical protein
VLCAAQGNEQQHSSLRACVVGLMQAREEDFAPFVEDDQSFAGYTARMRKVGAQLAAGDSNISSSSAGAGLLRESA